MRYKFRDDVRLAPATVRTGIPTMRRPDRPHSPLARLLWLTAYLESEDARLGPARVAAVIARYMNARSGHAWPAMATIAADLALCERSVRGYVRHLEDTGWVGTSRSRGRSSNRYELRWPTRQPTRQESLGVGAVEGAGQEPAQPGSPTADKQGIGERDRRSGRFASPTMGAETGADGAEGLQPDARL